MIKKKRSLVAILLIMVMILSQGAVFAQDVELYAVEIGGLGFESELKLSLADLKAMPAEAQIEEAYIYNSKAGEKSVEVKGVSLAYILNENAELNLENAEILFETSDNYSIDPQELQDVLNEDLKYVLAYEIDGEVIDNDDNPDNEEIVVYRKLKEDGEFNTVFKMVNKITVGESTVPTEEVEESMEILLTEIDWSEYEIKENTYSTNNSLGFHKINKVKGYDLLDIIGKDKLEEDKNYSLKFVSSDGFEIEKTLEELTNGYFFRDFTKESKETVAPMIAKYTKELGEFPKDELDGPVQWEDMDIVEEDLDKSFPRLVFGQIDVDDMNMSQWAKDVEKIIIEEVEETEDIVFTDITEEYLFAEEAIKDLAGRGIIDGMGDGLYAPEGELTRAQFCKIVVESLEYEKREYTGGFTDVASDYWGADYIQTAVDKGLFKGYTDDTFRPEEKINRQEMATVAGRAAVIAEKVSPEKIAKFAMAKSDYLDKDQVEEWAENGVAWLEAEKVFVGIASENFYPTKVVNRAEAALIIYNTLFK